MKVVQVEAEGHDRAQSKLAEKLGIEKDKLRLVEEKGRKFSFEVLLCPPKVDVIVTKNGMRAILNHLYLPIGEGAPALTNEFVEEELKKAGIVHGVKHDVIAKVVFEALHTPGYDEDRLLNLEVAVGTESVPAQAGKPKWEVDAKLFKKDKPIYVRKGDVIARAANAAKGQDGTTVTGEKIPAEVEDNFRLQTGDGIAMKRTETETLYVAESFGELINDHDVRIRLERKVIDIDDGLKAAFVVGKENFKGKPIRGEDLLAAAKAENLAEGFLTPEQIDKQIKATKKWPAKIVVAKGRDAVDGKAGEVEYLYRKAKSQSTLDVERAKARIAFPGEEIAVINDAVPPQDGFTVYGEKLRGRNYNELPVYPGSNVSQKNLDNKIVFVSNIYGKVTASEDRISVNHTLKISKDRMKVTMDLFPQQPLTFDDLNNLFRDADVLFGYDKERLASELEAAHKRGQRIEEFVVAKGQPVQAGVNAKLVYRFDPKNFQKKGLFSSKQELLFALPGDLLLKKIEPIDAEDGQNVYREKIPAPKDKEAKDIRITSGRNVIEKEAGEYGNKEDPLRVEYYAATMGTLEWKNKHIDIKSSVVVPEDESSISVGLAPVSDFGGRLTQDMIKKLAEEESVRVDLNTAEIAKFLREPRPEDGSLNTCVLAESIPPVHGEDSQVEYMVEYNERPIADFVGADKEEEPVFCDCVRPGDMLGKKTQAGNGQDGKSVFGRTLRAERGLDEPWMIGPGIDKSQDGLQIHCTLPTPGFVMVENNRLIVENPVRVAADKMSATMTVYPSNSSRFEPKEDKLLAMIHGKGVKVGVNIVKLQEIIEELNDTEKPIVDVVVAEGRAPGVGRDARFHHALDTDEKIGTVREDGSVDFKGKSVFHSVKKDQLLLVKHPATLGEDGQDVLGNTVPGAYGRDVTMRAGVGVKVSKNGLEYRAEDDGIVEITEDSIRVIPGLLISGDVDYKTGNIEAGKADVFIKGGVIPGFSVNSEKDINVEKEVEGAYLTAAENISCKGGIIGGREGEPGLTKAGNELAAMYISSGARIEVVGDIHVGTEILNSEIKTSGMVYCDQGAGTIYGGEIWTFGGVRARTLGAAGAETPTKIHLGLDYFKMKAAEKHLEDAGIEKQIKSLKKKFDDLGKDLKEVYDQIPAAKEEDHERAQKLQARYKALAERQKEVGAKLERFRSQKEAILSAVPRNKGVAVEVLDMIHPGVIITYEDVEWEIKEAMKGVRISWNAATSNLISKKL